MFVHRALVRWGAALQQRAATTTTAAPSFADAPAAAAAVDELCALYRSPVGESNYDPFCTQAEHALQTMLRAAEMGASSTLQVTAFLHDVGHLVLGEHAGDADFLAEDLQHELVGADYLQRLGFGDDVTQPIRLHVPAKRYLCAVDPEYWEQLSDGSKASLELQGGVMDAEEAAAYERDHAEAGQSAAQLRRWEDEGKNLFCHGGRDPVVFDAATEEQLRRWMGECLQQTAGDR